MVSRFMPYYNDDNDVLPLLCLAKLPQSIAYIIYAARTRCYYTVYSAVAESLSFVQSSRMKAFTFSVIQRRRGNG